MYVEKRRIRVCDQYEIASQTEKVFGNQSLGVWFLAGSWWGMWYTCTERAESRVVSHANIACVDGR